jgi:hypothetical protein
VNKGVAGAMIVAGWVQWLWPNWNGVLFEPSVGITVAEGRTIGAIFIVGAVIVWFMPQPPKT